MGSANDSMISSSRSRKQVNDKVKLPFTPYNNNQGRSFTSYLDKILYQNRQNSVQYNGAKSQLYYEGQVLKLFMDKASLIPYTVNHWTQIQDFVICIKTNKSAVNKIELTYEDKANRDNKVFYKRNMALPAIVKKSYC